MDINTFFEQELKRNYKKNSNNMKTKFILTMQTLSKN